MAINSWVADLIKTWGGVVLGWVLGLASTRIVERRKKRKELRAIEIAVSQELRELALRFLILIFQIEKMRGRLNRKLLEWLQPLVKRYEGPSPTQGLLASIETLLTNSDLLADLAKVSESPTLFFPREEARYGAVAASRAHDLAPEYASRLLDILSHLRIYNETREEQDYFHRLTFAPGMTSENHTLALQSTEGAVEAMGTRARIIVDKITAFEEKYSRRG